MRHFLNWHDDAPRDEMRAALLAEVEAELSRRTNTRTAWRPGDGLLTDDGVLSPAQ